MDRLGFDFKNRMIGIVEEEQEKLIKMPDALVKKDLLPYFHDALVYDSADSFTFDFQHNEILLNRPVNDVSRSNAFDDVFGCIKSIPSPNLSENRIQMGTLVQDMIERGNEVCFYRAGFKPILLCGDWNDRWEKTFQENNMAPVMIRSISVDGVNVDYDILFRNGIYEKECNRIRIKGFSGIDNMIQHRYTDNGIGRVLFTIAKPEGFLILYAAEYDLDFSPARLIERDGGSWDKFLSLDEGYADQCGYAYLREITDPAQLLRIKEKIMNDKADVLDELFRLQNVPQENWEWNGDRMD